MYINGCPYVSCYLNCSCTYYLYFPCMNPITTLQFVVDSQIFINLLLTQILKLLDLSSVQTLFSLQFVKFHTTHFPSFKMSTHSTAKSDMWTQWIFCFIWIHCRWSRIECLWKPTASMLLITRSATSGSINLDVVILMWESGKSEKPAETVWRQGIASISMWTWCSIARIARRTIARGPGIHG